MNGASTQTKWAIFLLVFGVIALLCGAVALGMGASGGLAPLFAGLGCLCSGASLLLNSRKRRQMAVERPRPSVN
jgi:uncharacterized membrane protein HdeD (DUF308 family)